MKKKVKGASLAHGMDSRDLYMHDDIYRFQQPLSDSTGFHHIGNPYQSLDRINLDPLIPHSSTPSSTGCATGCLQDESSLPASNTLLGPPHCRISQCAGVVQEGIKNDYVVPLHQLQPEHQQHNVTFINNKLIHREMPAATTIQHNLSVDPQLKLDTVASLSHLQDGILDFKPAPRVKPTSGQGSLDKPAPGNSFPTSDVLTSAEPKVQKCEHCEKEYADEKALKKHQHRHMQEKLHKCHLCNKGFVTFYELRRHCHTHSGQKPYQCKLCDKSYTSIGGLNRHVPTHNTSKEYQCSECDKRFHTEYNLKRHVIVHKGLKPHSCLVCGKSFAMKGNMIQHTLTHGAKIYPCTKCGNTYSTLVNLKKHEKRHDAKELAAVMGLQVCVRGTNGEGKEDNPDESHPSEKTNDGEQGVESKKSTPTTADSNSCHICSKSFANISTLRAHVLTHEGQRTHECEQCGKAFCTTYELNRHARTHTGERPFDCSVCSKKFGEKRTLKKHVELMHGERTFVCSKCDKSYTNQRDLDKHAHKHKVDRFACKFCLNTFPRKEDRLEHLKSHKEVKNCKLCNQVFASTAALNVHSKTFHSKTKTIPCTNCECKFSKKSDFVKHLKSHNTPQYSCEFCDMKFATQLKQTQHTSLHREGCRICDICDAVFESDVTLENHKLIRHWSEDKVTDTF